jgi:hypothetical protein
MATLNVTKKKGNRKGKPPREDKSKEPLPFPEGGRSQQLPLGTEGLP